MTSTSSGSMDADLIADKGEVSLEVPKAQELLAESWRTLLVIAANHHVRDTCTCSMGYSLLYMFVCVL